MKKFVAFLLSVLVLASLSLIPVSAEENGEIAVKKGDTVTYTISLSDVPDPIMTLDASIYYDTQYLKLVNQSAPNLKGYFSNNEPNGKITGEFIFNLISMEGVMFKNKKTFITLEFEAVKSGTTSITYIIRYLLDIYYPDSEHESINVYTITSDVTVNGKNVVEDKAPEINKDPDVVGDGTFVNTPEGLGKDNESAGLKGPSLNTGFVAGTGTVTFKGTQQNSNSSATSSNSNNSTAATSPNSNSNTNQNNNNSSANNSETTADITEASDSRNSTSKPATGDELKKSSQPSNLYLYIIIIVVVCVIAAGVVLFIVNKKKKLSKLR